MQSNGKQQNVYHLGLGKMMKSWILVVVWKTT